MTDIGTQLVNAIDKAQADAQSSGHRYHLGASIIGRRCVREIWYKFWWFHAVRLSGRMLRLYNRGHMEETRVVRWFRDIGAVVTADTEEQEIFSAFFGLFGGSGDGRVSNLDEYGLPGQGGLEVKTHNTKSFVNLVNKGVVSAKLEHYVQMQVYMAYFKLPWYLYVAVNKNDDDLYVEVVYPKPELADQYFQRAAKIILSDTPPARISEDPSWYECKFCDMKRICHEAAEPDKNCRTCQHIRLRLGEEATQDPAAVEQAHRWDCALHGPGIPESFTRKGCDKWEPKT